MMRIVVSTVVPVMPYAVTAMGVKQVVIRKIDGEDVLARIESEGVTLLNGAPAVVAAVLNAAQARRQRGQAVPGGNTVRMVVAGAPPPSKTIERVETELGWEFIQIYGLTETSPLLTINRAPQEWDALDAPERARRLSRAGVPAVGVRMATAEDISAAAAFLCSPAARNISGQVLPVNAGEPAG